MATKKILQNLTPQQYKEMLKLLPDMHKEKNRAITMLTFTFLALAILGLFAINPTLGTIFELRKQIDESEFIYEQLTTKMNALSNLQQQYSALSNDLPVVYDAMPKEAQAPLIVAQIQSLAQKANVTIKTLRVDKIALTEGNPTDQNALSFTLSLDAEGEYNALTTFASQLTQFSRIVTIESVSITKNQERNTLVLHVQSREYFKK